MRRDGKTTLMPEKLRGSLKWKILGTELILSHGGVNVAIWNPYGYLTPGVISIYGEPRGKTVFYKTWRGWKDRVWNLYRMRPPKEYTV